MKIDEAIDISYDDLQADYLLENGVVVLERDENDFNPDLYCPYCGNNLSSAGVFKQDGNEE